MERPDTLTYLISMVLIYTVCSVSPGPALSWVSQIFVCKKRVQMTDMCLSGRHVCDMPSTYVKERTDIVELNINVALIISAQCWHAHA